MDDDHRVVIANYAKESIMTKKEDEIPYALLTEVMGRWKADVLESFLRAEEIDVVLIQETVSDLFTSTFSPVKIFVPKANFERALGLLNTFNESEEETGDAEDGE